MTRRQRRALVDGGQRYSNCGRGNPSAEPRSQWMEATISVRKCEHKTDCRRMPTPTCEMPMIHVFAVLEKTLR